MWLTAKNIESWWQPFSDEKCVAVGRSKCAMFQAGSCWCQQYFIICFLTHFRGNVSFRMTWEWLYWLFTSKTRLTSQTRCQVVLTSLGGAGGSSASFGSQFQSPRLDSQLGFGLFILLHKSSLNRNDGPARILRVDLKVTKFPAEFNVDAERKNLDTEIWMCVRGGSATCLWNLLWHLGLKWICISKDKFACAAGAGVVSKHTSCPVWLR